MKVAVKKVRLRRRKPWVLYAVLLVIAAGFTFKYAYLAPGVEDRSTVVRNGELTYEFGPQYPETVQVAAVSHKRPVSAAGSGPAASAPDAPDTPPQMIPRDNGSVPPADKAPDEVKVAPAEFKDAGFFEGGRVSSGTVITGFRFGKEKDYRRVVIDFGVPDPKNPGKYLPAPGHPVYRVEYRSCPYRFTITFEGVGYADNAAVQKQYSLPFGLITDGKSQVRQLEFFVTKPAYFKVIEVDEPARLALDIKYKYDVEIPTVNVVQVVGVENVEKAFSLIETGAFPAVFSPQVVVLGDQFFVEGIYDTLEQAAKVSSELENMGYSTVISERKGNAFPSSSG